jgi:hypothetical protein
MDNGSVGNCNSAQFDLRQLLKYLSVKAPTTLLIIIFTPQQFFAGKRAPETYYLEGWLAEPVFWT